MILVFCFFSVSRKISTISDGVCSRRNEPLESMYSRNNVNASPNCGQLAGNNTNRTSIQLLTLHHHSPN